MPATRLVSAGLLLLGLGCTGTGSSRRDEAPRSVGGSSVQADSIAAVIERLRTVPGRFVQLPTRLWELQGMDSVLEAFVPFRDSAVVRLVGCLDQREPTATALDGRPVRLGVLCFEALTHVAYAEPEGSESGDWPGVIFPTATEDQLRAAKATWESVVRNRGYRFN